MIAHDWQIDLYDVNGFVVISSAYHVTSLPKRSSPAFFQEVTWLGKEIYNTLKEAAFLITKQLKWHWVTHFAVHLWQLNTVPAMPIHAKAYLWRESSAVAEMNKFGVCSFCVVYVTLKNRSSNALRFKTWQQVKGFDQTGFFGMKEFLSLIWNDTDRFHTLSKFFILRKSEKFLLNS